MESLTRDEAEAFFEKAADGVERGERILLAAFLDTQLVGTNRIVITTAPNQPHRADVAKLLVHGPARGREALRHQMKIASPTASATAP